MDFTRSIELLNKNLFWILLFIVGSIIYFIPIKIPSDISISGKVYPAKQWVLYAGSNGQFMDTEIDLVAGVSNVYSSREFMRGDDVRFEIYPEILSKTVIEKGDVIGKIYSNETHTLLNTARQELKVEEALLQTYETGEKEEDIIFAEKNLEYAKIDAEVQLLEYNRQKILYDQKVISDQEFDEQKRLLGLKQAQVAINEAELQSLRSGKKSSEVEYVKAEIEKIKSDIADLEMKLQLHTITSPITGIFRNSFSADTLMVIESAHELIIKMPVSLKDRNRVFIGQKANCSIYGLKGEFSSEVVDISNYVGVAGGKQIFIVTAKIIESQVEILPGVVFKGKLSGDKVLLRDYIRKWFRFL
jgi:hypothetical protein